eukprot:ctg_5568.g650
MSARRFIERHSCSRLHRFREQARQVTPPRPPSTPPSSPEGLGDCRRQLHHSDGRADGSGCVDWR